MIFRVVKEAFMKALSSQERFSDRVFGKVLGIGFLYAGVGTVGSLGLSVLTCKFPDERVKTAKDWSDKTKELEDKFREDEFDAFQYAIFKERVQNQAYKRMLAVLLNQNDFIRRCVLNAAEHVANSAKEGEKTVLNDFLMGVADENEDFVADVESYVKTAAVDDVMDKAHAVDKANVVEK